jgi:hypothetical protein
MSKNIFTHVNEDTEMPQNIGFSLLSETASYPKIASLATMLSKLQNLQSIKLSPENQTNQIPV